LWYSRLNQEVFPFPSIPNLKPAKILSTFIINRLDCLCHVSCLMGNQYSPYNTTIRSLKFLTVNPSDRIRNSTIPALTPIPHGVRHFMIVGIPQERCVGDHESGNTSVPEGSADSVMRLDRVPVGREKS